MRVKTLTQQVGDFLKSRYDFCYNLLTEETEFRPAGERNTAFLLIGKRELNTLCLEARAAEDAAPQSRYWFTKDEKLKLSAAYIYKVLKDTNAAAMCDSNPATFGQVLSVVGMVRKHTKQGKVYVVKLVNAGNPIEDA